MAPARLNFAHFNMALVDDNIGHWIATQRLNRGMTQKQLARRTGTAQSAISRMENGTVSPTIKTLRKVFEGLGTELYMGCNEVKQGALL